MRTLFTRSVELLQGVSLHGKLSAGGNGLNYLAAMPRRPEPAKRLKQARENADLTLREVSDRSGGVYSISRLGNFEQGLRRFQPHDAEILGNILGVSAAHLLCLKEPEGAEQMTQDENRLLRAFRALDEKDRHAELMHLEVMALPHRRAASDRQVSRAYGKPSVKKTTQN